MIDALWTWQDLVDAAEATADGAPGIPITGFSIDTRSLQPGEVFVALRDQRDGHEFVGAAFERGAAAAIVAKDYGRKPGDGALLRVSDPLEGLTAIARAARARTNARIVAVTGSVGKTGTKEALRVALSPLGPTHAAEKSFNNHWGVPLTLARMPADVRYGVFEIGMNHAGEITPLTQLVRPHVAIITTVEPVHLEFFGSVEAIADAKAEIFVGLEKYVREEQDRGSGPAGKAYGGYTAILNRDNPQYDRLARAAALRGVEIVSFGSHPEADLRADVLELGPTGTNVSAVLKGRRIDYRVGAPGAHIAQNSLAVVAAIDALGADVEQAVAALVGLSAPKGRGERSKIGLENGAILLIDESYNANPASMRSALAAMAGVPRDEFPRRIAVLGDMLELGEQSGSLHEGLKDSVDAAEVDLVFACGSSMQRLFDALPSERRGEWAPASQGILGPLMATVRAGDVIMVKGSLGSRMAPIVEALLQKGQEGRVGLASGK